MSAAPPIYLVDISQSFDRIQPMNILALSDIHGRIPKLPKAIAESPIELFIDCGDTCGHFSKNWSYNDYFQRMVNVEAEANDQLGWLKDTYKPWIEKTLKPKHIIRLNGNHDFGECPEGLFEHYLFQGSKTIIIEGIKIGMMTGMGQLVNEWHDEIPEEEFQRRIEGIDRDIQYLVTHMPPHGILDQAYSGDRIGSRALTQAIFGRLGETPYFTHLTHHWFGHAHEARGKEEHDIDGRKITFMNVAETYATLDSHRGNRVSFHSK